MNASDLSPLRGLPLTEDPSRQFARRRVLLAIGLAALLPIALLSVVLARVSSQSIREQAESNVASSARASANGVEQELARLAEIVTAYSQLRLTQDAVRDQDPAALQEVLRPLFDDRGDVSLAFVVDETGRLIDVLPPTPTAIGVDFSFRNWFIGVSELGSTYVSTAFQPATDLPLTLVAVAPVFSPDDPGLIIGYIGTGLTLIDLQAFVDDFASDQGVSLTVTDQIGVVVASPGGTPTVIESVRQRPEVSAALDGVASQGDVDRDGVGYLSATVPVDRFGWTVTAEVPNDVALAARNSILTIAIGLAGVLGLIVAVVMIRLAGALRRQADAVERVRESESFLDSIVENIPLVVSVKEAKGLRFVRVNRAAAETLQGDNDSIIGSRALSVMDRRWALAQEENNRQVVESGLPIRIENLEVVDASGRKNINLQQIPIVDSEGDVTHILEIGEDVTSIVESFREIEAAWAEAEKANTAKSEFLSRMSHELRTPLNAVLGFGQLLEMEALTDDQRASVQQILRGGRHLLGLINEVLDISRIESGTLSLSVEPVALGPLINETIELVRPLAATEDLSIPEGPMPDWERWAKADQQRLRQVLLNLLSNAVKYNEPGGRISVRCEDVDGSRLRIKVSDTGRGLSRDQVDRIFSPFERLGAEGSGVEGTGLGLALSKRLVEAMHGSIGVQTELGVGSTFWVELGASHEEETISSPAPQVFGAERRPDMARLLHVDDRFDRLRWVEDMLADHHDIELVSIADAETAMDMAVHFRPDAMLIDLGVDGVDPFELIERLAADPATAEIEVLSIADHPIGEGTELTQRTHLVRPLADETLIAELRDALAVSIARVV